MAKPGMDLQYGGGRKKTRDKEMSGRRQTTGKEAFVGYRVLSFMEIMKVAM
jgi:hypothetical protein